MPLDTSLGICPNRVKTPGDGQELYLSLITNTRMTLASLVYYNITSISLPWSDVDKTEDVLKSDCTAYEFSRQNYA